MKEQLIALFGGAKPTVQKFHEFLNGMPLEERGIFFDRTFGLALSGWTGLTVTYRLFFDTFDQEKTSVVCGLCPAKDGVG